MNIVVYVYYFLQCKVNKKYLAPNRAPAPDGMMATKNMNYAVYQDLLHDPLMRDPVLPTGFDSDQKQEGKAWLTKDGIRFVHVGMCSDLYYLSLGKFPWETFYFLIDSISQDFIIVVF